MWFNVLNPLTFIIEGLREGRRFFELAKQITKKKPIVVMRAGGTDNLAKAAKSNPAALSGSGQIYEAIPGKRI